MLRDSKAFVDIHRAALDQLEPHTGTAVPPGAMALALPPVDLSGLTGAAIEFAANQLVARFGGLAEGYLVSHREQILSVVPTVVLTLAKDVLAKLTSGE